MALRVRTALTVRRRRSANSTSGTFPSNAVSSAVHSCQCRASVPVCQCSASRASASVVPVSVLTIYTTGLGWREAPGPPDSLFSL